MDFFQYLPTILQILRLIPQIQEALRSGASVIDLLRKFGPEVLPIIEQYGTKLFPGLSQPQAVAAGALVLSPDIVKETQLALNRLGVTDDAGQPLAPDGSYGQKTKQAVTKFQAAHGLTPDGWAGKVTQAAIAGEVAKLPVA